MCDFLFSSFVSLFSEFIFFGGSDIYRRVEKVEHWDFAQHDRLCALHIKYVYVQQHRERTSRRGELTFFGSHRKYRIIICEEFSVFLHLGFFDDVEKRGAK